MGNQIDCAPEKREKDAEEDSPKLRRENSRRSLQEKLKEKPPNKRADCCDGKDGPTDSDDTGSSPSKSRSPKRGLVRTSTSLPAVAVGKESSAPQSSASKDRKDTLNVSNGVHTNEGISPKRNTGSPVTPTVEPAAAAPAAATTKMQTIIHALVVVIAICTSITASAVVEHAWHDASPLGIKGVLLKMSAGFAAWLMTMIKVSSMGCALVGTTWTTWHILHNYKDSLSTPEEKELKRSKLRHSATPVARSSSLAKAASEEEMAEWVNHTSAEWLNFVIAGLLAHAIIMQQPVALVVG